MTSNVLVFALYNIIYNSKDNLFLMFKMGISFKLSLFLWEIVVVNVENMDK
ncbi:hypothetical protein EMUCRT_0703 [Ehrlichia cf. muris str. EmCRT]|uniref:Uncharacterized protein n=1 Tax=Ehrlichia cf. muris str. EmCRT TaxID=1359167 RepID=A0A0F3NDF9_9RICK|nr:hypothetical protein EMUCRT_0703 [Ehrlichia cf. muris str. EmCRT]